MRELDQYDEAVVAGAFDTVAARYGEVAFLRRAAEMLADTVGPPPPEARVLDVATGPGTAALIVAARAPDARVVGLDVAPDMVARASARALAEGLANTRFVVGSALAPPFEAGSFDLVLCASAIYYMPDLVAAVRAWREVLAPGGRLAFSTFADGALEPMSSLFDARVRAAGIAVPQPTPLYRLTSPDACSQLLEAAGLTEVRVARRQLGYFAPDVDHWWQVVMSTGFRLLVEALDRPGREAFEQAHREEVARHQTDRGLWVNVPVIVAHGRVPRAPT
jgi:arsenite methyltransferase